MQSMIETAKNKLRPLVDTVTSYCKLLKRKRGARESIAKWEHRLDSVLLQVGLPGLKSKADEQSENKRGSEVQNEEESLGETKSFKAKFKIEDLCDEDSLQRAVEPLTSSLDDAIQLRTAEKPRSIWKDVFSPSSLSSGRNQPISRLISKNSIVP